jgi:hypothetical protein
LVAELLEKLKDPRYLSETTSNRQIILNTFFRYKFNELSVEKDRLNRENEELSDKVIDLEEKIQKGHFEGDMDTINSDMGEDEIQIYTYILIKNFEVLKLTQKTIEEVYYVIIVGVV